ncbi:hypothetical protein [Mycoplana sp. MJR14]|uniref:hypothetical protein n=1 Tax=Mycoplana sp. MJR14 TaxID=3032583 RepID=UPI0023DA80FA|nr:hypothetical protein [Mycoplana sp. MJR14]MDF1635116.1 hypothetical protein [Mycoplana sp. MJR14]
MKRSGLEPPETAERRRRSGASVLHAPVVPAVRSPLLAAAARRQPEAARDSAQVDDDQAFVVPIAELDTP